MPKREIIMAPLGASHGPELGENAPSGPTGSGNGKPVGCAVHHFAANRVIMPPCPQTVPQAKIARAWPQVQSLQRRPQPPFRFRQPLKARAEPPWPRPPQRLGMRRDPPRPAPAPPRLRAERSARSPAQPRMCSGGSAASLPVSAAAAMSSVLARRHDARAPSAAAPPPARDGKKPASDPPTRPDPAPEKPPHPAPPPPASPASLSKTKPPRRRSLHALACAAAIMVSLMGYSILQERIMTRPYLAPNDDDVIDDRVRDAAQLDATPPAFFKNSLFLVLANRLFAAGVALCVILVKGERESLRSKAPLLDYVSISLSNVIATSCQYEALKWLTFPTVTIGKCAKMLPVMIILNMRSGKQYSIEDFGIVGVVLAGCAVMISSGNVVAKNTGAADEDTPFGFGLLVAYLIFDAITSTYQQRLFEKYDMTVYNQMLYINVSSASLSIAGLTLSGGLFSSMRFLRMYPRILPDIAMLSLSAVAGQFAITYTIQAFGALLYAGIMTTRQFCSVLASDIIFKHGLTMLQWTGALMVFSALFYKLWRKASQSIE